MHPMNRRGKRSVLPYWLLGFMLAMPLPTAEWRLEEDAVEERHQRRILYDPGMARAYLEKLRWPGGATCTHCGAVGGHCLLNGKGHRPGLWKCRSCRQQFSVTLGTAFEDTKVGLEVWLRAVNLLSSSNEMSIRQLHKTLGVSYKTAWLMTQRIRGAMSAAIAEKRI